MTKVSQSLIIRGILTCDMGIFVGDLVLGWGGGGMIRHQRMRVTMGGEADKVAKSRAQKA